MLGHPIYTGALLLGALVFSVYCYYTYEGRRNSAHQYQHHRGNSYDSPPRRRNPARSNFSEVSTTDCIICLNTQPGECVTLNCNHSFHSLCINRWFSEQGRSCPICRQR